jgi:hypothetical protein
VGLTVWVDRQGVGSSALEQSALRRYPSMLAIYICPSRVNSRIGGRSPRTFMTGNRGLYRVKNGRRSMDIPVKHPGHLGSSIERVCGSRVCDHFTFDDRGSGWTLETLTDSLGWRPGNAGIYSGMAHKANARLEGCRRGDIASPSMFFPVSRCLRASGLAMVGHSHPTGTGEKSMGQGSPELKALHGWAAPDDEHHFSLEVASIGLIRMSAGDSA